jgi:hypothetical protein
MVKKIIIPNTGRGPSHLDAHPDKDEQKAIDESRETTTSRPGGFANDPDDPSNPNEASRSTGDTVVSRALLPVTEKATLRIVEFAAA